MLASHLSCIWLTIQTMLIMAPWFRLDTTHYSLQATATTVGGRIVTHPTAAGQRQKIDSVVERRTTGSTYESGQKKNEPSRYGTVQQAHQHERSESALVIFF